jgi:hypothetical protein
LSKVAQMLKNIIILMLLCFLSHYGYTQDKLSKEEAIKDVEIAYNRMNQIHPGLYRYQTADNYQQTFKNIKDSIKDSINDSINDYISYLDFFRRISPLLSEVKDLHTSYAHSKEYKKTHENWLPFMMKEIEGQNLIVYNASSDSSLIEGLELLEVNGQPIENIKAFLRENIGTDNGNAEAKQIYSTKNLYGYYPKFYALGDSVLVLTKNLANDSLIIFNLASVKPRTFSANIASRYPLKVRKNLGYSILDSASHTAKIDVSSFVQKKSPLDIFQKKFSKNLKKSFKKVEEDSIQNLVLDFRGNGGGYIPNVTKLIKYVALEPFKMIDTMSLRRSAYFKIFPIQRIMPPLMAHLFFNKTDKEYRYRGNNSQPRKKPKDNAYSGELYVFMDAASYSATAFTICLLKDMERAIFFGEHPGGANWGSHAGSWYKVKLPNSKIQLRIPQYRIVHARTHRSHEDFFVQPDIKVDYTIEDFEKNVDSYERALKEFLK